MALRYGVRLEQSGPASDAARDDRMRCRSAHSATVCAGSWAKSRAQATTISSAPSKLAKFNFDLRHFGKMAAQVAHQHLLHGMGLGPEFGGDVGRDPGRPVEPGIPLPPRQIEDHRRCSGAIDDLAFHLLQSHPGGLGFQHLIRHPRLDEGHLAAVTRRRPRVCPGLGQGFGHGAESLPRPRLGARRCPVCGRRAAPQIPGMGAALVELAGKADATGLRAVPINPVSSSPKALARYRDLAVLAIEARENRV